MADRKKYFRKLKVLNEVNEVGRTVQEIMRNCV